MGYVGSLEDLLQRFYSQVFFFTYKYIEFFYIKNVF